MLTLVLVLGAALLTPALGFGEDPTREQYGDELTNINRDVSGGGDAGSNDRVVGSLPFTGVDLIGLVAVSVALVSTGLVVRRIRVFGAPR